MVGWAIDAVRAMDVVEPLIVDLCTGSGAIALALAQEVPRSRVHAVELSEDALRWTRKNMEGSRVDLRQGNALDAFRDLDGQVDLVVSNPPYIPLTEWEYVAPEARDYDPELALFSGEDGLDTHPRPGTHRTPAAAARRRRRRRARRHPGRPGAVDLHRGAGLGRRGRPPGPQQPAAVRDRPQGAAVMSTRPTTSTPTAVRVRGGPLDGTAIRHQRRDRPHDRSARGRVRRPPGRARGAADRHRVRHRRRRVHLRGRRPTCWRPRAGAATCPRPCSSAPRTPCTASSPTSPRWPGSWSTPSGRAR